MKNFESFVNKNKSSYNKLTNPPKLEPHEIEEIKSSQIKKLCDRYDVRWYTINSDYSIDIDGSVMLNDRKLESIPIKFNRVGGHFSISQNRIRTLENSPKYVGKYFLIGSNKIKTLLHGPTTVIGGYHCQGCNLRDVYGFPDTYKGSLLIHNNPVYAIIRLVGERIDYIDPDDVNVEQRRLQSFKAVSDQVRFVKLLNEYKVIRNMDTIIEDRLMEALYHFGIETLKKTEFYSYKLI